MIDWTLVDGDPLVMYLVVRESLSMSPGKLAAQCGHAVQMLMQAYSDVQGSPGARDFDAWLGGDYRKVVLRADERAWEKLRHEPVVHVRVRDLGLTEVAGGSETVLGFWPMRKSAASKTLKRLRLL